MSSKSVRNYEKKILGMSDAWVMSHLYHWPSDPAYYTVDYQIINVFTEFAGQINEPGLILIQTRLVRSGLLISIYNYD